MSRGCATNAHISTGAVKCRPLIYLGQFSRICPLFSDLGKRGMLERCWVLSCVVRLWSVSFLIAAAVASRQKLSM